jgi:hypothetical protein
MTTVMQVVAQGLVVESVCGGLVYVVLLGVGMQDRGAQRISDVVRKYLYLLQ